MHIERKQRNEDFLAACGKFHKGAARVDFSRAQALFEREIDINYVDADGWTALMYGSGEGHLKLVSWLVEDCGAEVDLKSADECTALWIACFNGRRDIVQFLLRMGADEKVIGKPEGEPMQNPALAARRNGNPGIADLVDVETELRSQDPTRKGRQMSREMTVEEYRDSLRGNLMSMPSV